MSGIAGVLHLDGSPVDAALFGRMIDSLQFRGPRTRVALPCPFIALGHARLRLNDDETEDAPQPFTLDGREWIVAHGRIDARSDLVARLADVEAVPPDAEDGELILRAYRARGEGCVEHLLGDFVFAIWDGPRRRLFAARDQIGIKPLYYAENERAIVFSNSLDCVRMHPQVLRELNDDAIADFLLFGGNQSFDTTTFRDIRRLPPAHAMTWSPTTSSRRRDWTLPVDEPVIGKRASEDTDRFLELLRASVSDRLRTGRVAVFMSGGLDSTTLAAIAQETGRGRPGGTDVHAVTSIYERLIPDTERPDASLVARHLKIPIHFDIRDDELSVADWHRVTVHTPEPVGNPAAFLAGVRFLATMSDHARVFLYGEGPDDALRYEWRPLLAHLASRRRVGALIGAVVSDLVMHPRVPLWSSLRALGGRRRADALWRPVFPDWLADDFVRRTACRDRWEAQLSPGCTGASNPASGAPGVQLAALAAAVRGVRHSGRSLSHGIPPPLSRSAAATIPARAAGDAVVPEKTDRSESHAADVARAGASPKENGRGGGRGPRAGGEVGLAEAGAGAGLRAFRRCHADADVACDASRDARGAAPAWLELLVAGSGERLMEDSMTKPQPASGERAPQTARKPYQKPELQVYGDLAAITQGISGSKTNDGSGHNNMHFTS